MSTLYKRLFNYIQPTRLSGSEVKNIPPAARRLYRGLCCCCCFNIQHTEPADNRGWTRTLQQITEGKLKQRFNLLAYQQTGSEAENENERCDLCSGASITASGFYLRAAGMCVHLQNEMTCWCVLRPTHTHTHTHTHTLYLSISRAPG